MNHVQNQLLQRAGLAVRYLAAEASMAVNGSVSEAVYDQRITACLKCEHRKPHPECALPVKIGWCGKCGCGDRSRAELTTKAQMPLAKCPEKRWNN